MPLLAGLAVLVILALGGGAAVYFLSGDGGASSDEGGIRRTAAELARKGLNCMQTTPVKESVAPAQERVKCATGGGSDAVVSTFENADAARKDADRVLDKQSSGAKKERGLVVGPYWTVNCSLRQVCEGAQDYLDGELLS